MNFEIMKVTGWSHPEDLSWVVEDLIPCHSFVAIYGARGSGKTTVAWDLALTLAGASDRGDATWAGFRVPAAGTTLFVSAEGVMYSEDDLRAQAWAVHRGLSEPPEVSQIKQPLDLLNEHVVESLHADLSSLARERTFFGTIIVDTLSRCMPGGDENSSTSMTRAVDALDGIRRRHHMTVIVIHHSPRGGNTIRGHSSLEAALDVALHIEEGSSARTMTVTKLRQRPAPPPVDFRLVDVPIGVTEEGKTISAATVEWLGRGRAAGADQAVGEKARHALRILAQAAVPPTGQEWQRASGLPETTFRRAKRSLVAGGLVVLLADGRFCCATTSATTPLI